MNPEQPAPPAPGGNYDFIMSPPKPPKPKVVSSISGNKFVMKIVFIAGGAVLVIAVAAILVNVIFGNKNNYADIISITQSEQEIIRLSIEGNAADAQTINNAAVNTELTMKTQQQAWLAFLQKHGQKVAPETLLAKKNLKTDKALSAAKQTSTFDSAYKTLLRKDLAAYAAELRTAYNGATNTQERAMLNTYYQQTNLLLQQWPE